MNANFLLTQLLFSNVHCEDQIENIHRRSYKHEIHISWKSVSQRISVYAITSVRMLKETYKSNFHNSKLYTQNGNVTVKSVHALRS